MDKNRLIYTLAGLRKEQQEILYESLKDYGTSDEDIATLKDGVEKYRACLMREITEELRGEL